MWKKHKNDDFDDFLTFPKNPKKVEKTAKNSKKRRFWRFLGRGTLFSQKRVDFPSSATGIRIFSCFFPLPENGGNPLFPKRGTFSDPPDHFLFPPFPGSGLFWTPKSTFFGPFLKIWKTLKIRVFTCFLIKTRFLKKCVFTEKWWKNWWKYCF